MNCYYVLPHVYLLYICMREALKKLSLQGSRSSLIQKCFVNQSLSILLLAIG